MPVTPSASRGPRAAATFALLAVLGLLASCGTRENNQLGVSLIEEQGERKAVRLVEVTAPDSSREYQLDASPEGAGGLGTILVGARPGFRATSLVRFSAEGLPAAGAVVDSASLELSYGTALGDTSPFRMLLYAVISDWDEGSTDPDSLPTLAAAPFDSVDVPFPPDEVDTVRVALGAIVQGWVDDAANNFGVAIVPAEGQDSEVEFGSRDSIDPPRLLVHTTADGEVQTSTLAPSADTFALAKTPDFVPVIGTPGRLAIARGIPARFLAAYSWEDLGDRATIHRAELTLHLDADASRLNSFSIGVQRVLSQPWAADSTDVDSVLFGVTTVSADTDSVNLQVTTIVEEMLEEPNDGFQIRAVEERTDTDTALFHGPDSEDPAKTPTLRIWYTPDDSEVAP